MKGNFVYLLKSLKKNQNLKIRYLAFVDFPLAQKGLMYFKLNTYSVP
ncbi:MAG: hypothetical protein MW689_000705 [Thermodesulfobacteria bacterium]|nr:hypothetical protein [Thermodesulfobacteriota bacterium]